MTARLHAVLFAALCLAGVGASVALTVHEVVRTAPITLDVTNTHRVGDTTLVTVAIHNTTGTTRCQSIRVAARDRAGHDLAAVTAVRDLSLPAHSRRTLVARLSLTPRQYAEQLDAFYPSAQPCSGPGEGSLR